MDKKERLGWDSFFETKFSELPEEDFFAARVAVKHKDQYELKNENGDICGKISGKFHYRSLEDGFPAVGDWVYCKMDPSLEYAVIIGIIGRKTKFSRKMVGNAAREQIMVANIDTLFLVSSFNNEFNERRIERYLAMIKDGGINPVLILNKSDLESEKVSMLSALKNICKDVPVHAVSAKTGEGIDQLKQYLKEGKTAAFIGSSGVGKSTLINALSGKDLMKTGEIRESDDKGRHTTTNREMLLLPIGIIIDNPGMREMQLWDTEKGIEEAFEDIKELEKECHFSNCSHSNEKDCAIKAAIDTGELSEKRYENYLKMKEESIKIRKKREMLQDKRKFKKKKR